MARELRPLLPLITPRSSSQGWGSGGASFAPKLPKPTTTSRAEETALQRLEALWLAKQKKNKGFLGNVLSGSWKGISSFLDFITRPSYAIAEGTRRALHGDDNDFDVDDFFSGAWAGLSGKKKTGFGQVLGEHDIGGKRLQGILGFGLDVATDPIMLASIAAAPVTGGASLGILSTKLAARGLTVKAVQDAAKIAEHGIDDIGELRRARDVLSTAGDGFTARAALADKRIEEFLYKTDDAKDMAQGIVPSRWTKARASELHGLQAFAKAEAKQDLPNVLSFTYKIPFAKKTTQKYLQNGRIVLRSPIKTVGAKTIADLKIPVVAKTAEAIGRAFKPGWRNEKFHALERVGRATVEVREREYIGAIGHLLKPYINPRGEKFLDKATQLDALDWGETAKGVVLNASDKDGNIVSRILNRKMIKGAVDEGRLSPLQAEFLHAWHKATEVLSDADMDYGRLYGPVSKSAKKDGQDVIYVPHIYTRDGRKVTKTLGASIMTKPGFQYERLANQPNSVKGLKELHESGQYADLMETDPATLLAMRARRGAQAHADSMVEKIIATSEGIPTKIADVVKQKKHLDAIDGREANIAKLPLATTEGYQQAAREMAQEIRDRVDVKRQAAIAKHDSRTTELRKQIKALQDSLRKRVGLPSGNQITHMSSKDFNDMFGGNPKLRAVHAHGQRVRSSYSAAQSARRTMRALAPSETRIQKGAFFHVAPKEAREEIRKNGIGPNVTSGTAKGRLRVYKKLKDAEAKAAKEGLDVWVINPTRATKFTTRNPAKMHTIAHAMDRSDVRLYQGTTAARVHGYKHRNLLVQLFRDSKMTVPSTSKTSARAAQMAGKHARAFNRDLASLKKFLLDTPMQRRRADGLLDNWENRLKEAIVAIERKSRGDWDDYLKDIGYKAPPANRRSVLAAKKRALALHQQRRDDINKRFNNATANAILKRLPKLEAKAARQRKAADTQRKLIDKHAKAVEHHETSLANPLAKKQGFVKNDKIRAENGSAMVIPVEIDEAIKRIRHNIHDDQFLADFQRTWARNMGKWKVAVTVINPGYRIRNTVSDMWNMFVSPEGGVPLWAMGRYGAMSADLIYKKIPAGDPKALALFQEAYEHSIMSGLFGGDVERVLRTMRSGFNEVRGRDLARDKKLVKAYTTFATKFNRDAENWGRLTHYLYRRVHQGKSPAEAARIVRIAHFDYEDLTPTERKIKGYLVPFYTWTRNNVPYQLQAMFSQPGRYSTFQKFVNEMEYAAGGEEAGLAPEWIDDAFGFRVPFGGKNNFMLPQFGPSDLAKLQSPQQAVGLLGPFVKAPIELITNKSMLTGAPIYGSELTHPRNPVSGAAASVLQFLPGANVGQTARPVGGETMTGPGASPLISYLAGQTPLTNVLVNQTSNIRRAQRGRNASLLSYFGGVSTYAPDREQTLGIAEQQSTRAFRQYVRGLRDEGLWPESEQTELSAFDKKRRKLLEQILINR